MRFHAAGQQSDLVPTDYHTFFLSFFPEHLECSGKTNDVVGEHTVYSYYAHSYHKSEN